ncbi:MAG: 3,4-dihydroxy-2-butanone-4-phosphate synthase [Alphaproteobacteria bacterium GM202ARS2]|nr:3,4-dihydroxy-2-butanone-4-phosphate synthase [Alphaproteobacteria bacterium GM202ARS2]
MRQGRKSLRGSLQGGLELSGSSSTMETIIAAFKAGEMIVVTDDAARENEGDLVVAAEAVNAEVINFMARYGRGLICLALDSERVDALGLHLMSPVNRSRHKTAFTVSIEAAAGITTGISAADRAHTIATAIDPRKGAGDIVTPGHVFPLVAREGGVLVRAGHTEAAVDLARIAGLRPCGVICEIMNDDGTMAKGEPLRQFAAHHRLKMTTIAELIAWRLRFETLVTCQATRDFHGCDDDVWTMKVYTSAPQVCEHVALIKGKGHIDSLMAKGGEGIPVRVHRSQGLYDGLAALQSRHQPSSLQKAMRWITQKGYGVIILIGGEPQVSVHEAGEAPPQEQRARQKGGMDLREYGIGAQILRALGITNMVLLSQSKPILHALDGYGLKVVGYQSLDNVKV